MKFFYFKNKMYDLVGWSNYLDPTGMYLLDKFCELEQIYHYNSKSKVDWDLQSEWFFASDMDLINFTKIKSRTTLKKHIDKLMEFNLIKIKEDRAKNHKGKATEYLIVKPMPLPPHIEIPKMYVERNGLNFLEQLIVEHKTLFEEHSVHSLSAHNLNILNEETKIKAPNNCAPRIERELEREKERSKKEKFSNEKFSEKQKKIVSLCSNYIPQAASIVSPYFEKITEQKEEMILLVLEKNDSNNFKPGNAHQFIFSLFTDNNELEKLGAATLNETNGFSKKILDFSTYADKKETSKRRAASKVTDRDYYDEVFKNFEKRNLDKVQIVPDDKLSW